MLVFFVSRQDVLHITISFYRNEIQNIYLCKLCNAMSFFSSEIRHETKTVFKTRKLYYLRHYPRA